MFSVQAVSLLSQNLQKLLLKSCIFIFIDILHITDNGCTRQDQDHMNFGFYSFSDYAWNKANTICRENSINNPFKILHVVLSNAL